MSGWFIALIVLLVGLPAVAWATKMSIPHIGGSIIMGVLLLFIARKAGAR